MVAWQGMRLEHEALVTDVMLTLKGGWVCIIVHLGVCVYTSL